MNIALFGGTFDPIHNGHLEAARAAAQNFSLDRVLFIPTGKPPHKHGNQLTPFPHRFAMVALACATEPRFVPSQLEAPRADGRPHYSIDTIRGVMKTVARNENLYFLVGVDAFLDLPHWKNYRRLFDLVHFIIVSRPGFDSRRILKILPRKALACAPSASNNSDRILLKNNNIYILRRVNEPVSSRGIREAIRARRPVTGLIPPLVEEYLLKEGLYRPAQPRRR